MADCNKEDTLIRAVCSSDQRDGRALLLYSDYLDEHGYTERAEYLRLQVNWTIEVYRTQNPYEWKHLPRLRELLEHPAIKPSHISWFPHTRASRLPWLPTETQFNSWSDFEVHAATRFSLSLHSCWRVSFDIRRKRRWKPKHVRRLTAVPELIRVLDLDLTNIKVEQDGARAIAESPYVANLARLDLSRCNIADEGAIALATSAHLAGLVYLNVGGNSLTEAGLQHLVNRFGKAVRIIRD